MVEKSDMSVDMMDFAIVKITDEDCSVCRHFRRFCCSSSRSCVPVLGS